ncbi:MAG TPA: DNA-directed RNA polymerase subunit alpha [candidate division Zixibacteria bacterium]|nr:DNA-directed RNA polymerase subunit alpha [candidate division Zixibacteria bacterium]
MKWKSMQMPKEVVLEPSTATQNFGRFFFEPLEQGYGVTIGNALRRVVLNSMQGAAITAVRIEGVQHEFSTIPGVLEDLTEIIINLKGVRFKVNSDYPKPLKIDVDKEGEITAKDIICDPAIEILNKNHHIATLTEKTKFIAHLDMGFGKGYRTAEENKKDDVPVGTIPIDSIFTPVLKVEYHVEPARVGQKTDFDRLIFDITTDGSILPEEALAMSAKLLIDHFDHFLSPETDLDRIEDEQVDEEMLKIRELLKMPVEELELSVRSSNCLRAAKIKNLEELVQKTEPEMLQYRNFGRKSLAEINEVLAKFGLSFGMDLSKFMDKKEG